MTRRLLLFSLLLILDAVIAKPVAGVELALRVEGIDKPVKIFVEASATDSAKTIKASDLVEAGAILTLELNGNHVWEIAARAEGYWTPHQTIFLKEKESLLLRFWPTGVLKGHFSVSDTVPKPSLFQAYFQTLPDAGNGSPQEGSVPCEVSGSDFSCRPPLGLWDFKLRAPGFVSHFFWEKDLKVGAPLDIGTLRLKQGGSIVGFVTLEGHPRHALDSCRVTLKEPETGIQAEDLKQRLSKKAINGKVDSRGFFHLQGVAPGVYELVVKHPDLAPERVFPVEVYTNSETEIRPAISMRPFASLDINIEPPADPRGQPWTVQLLDWRLGTPVNGSIGHAVADGGLLQIDGLRRGVFMVVVKDSRGAKFAYRRVELSSRVQSISIDIDMLQIKGTVLLGENPLAAELSFMELRDSEPGNESPHRKIGPVLSDEQGKFEDYLPTEGRYKVVIKSDEPRLTRTLSGIEVHQSPGHDFARVDIDLPKTELRGKVIDDDQKGIEAARIQVLSTSGTVGVEALMSDKDGHFEIFGLTSGQYRIQAFDGDQASEAVTISVDEGQSPAPITLMLKEQPMFRGTVFDEIGPVVGARVEAIVGAVTKIAMTGLDGSFSLPLPGFTGTEVPFAILAPGRSLHLGRAQVQREAPPTKVLLSRRSGSLEFTNPSAKDQTRLAWLISSSGFVFGSTVDKWASFHGLPLVTTAVEGLIPALEPGPYTICALKFDELLSLLSSATIDPSATVSAWTQTHPKTCGSGEVLAEGTAHIELPTR